MSKRILTLFSFMLIFSLSFPQGTVDYAVQAAAYAQVDSPSGVYRAWVKIPNEAARQRLERTGARVLSREKESALVLATDIQLQNLARLQLRPYQVDELNALVQMHAAQKPWLANSLGLFLKQASTAWEAQQTALQGVEMVSLDTPDTLAFLLAGLTAEQMSALAALDEIDSDNDGLTDTEEAWWCTNPNDPNTDGDGAGYKDGVEIAALLDFTQPRSARWGYGPPFGPPRAWPDFNGADGNPATAACNDGDYDTIPDLAEVYMVGTRVPEESSDRDKFDDGQELFGVTYCPGGTASCGYGSYPRMEYWNYIKASMPAWVLPPGDNPFVAAFPIPEISVVPGSWNVERVTVVTTEEGQMEQTSHSYETTVTKGTSTSKTETKTWNRWESVSKPIQKPQSAMNNLVLSSTEEGIVDIFKKVLFGSAKLAAADSLYTAARASCESSISGGVAIPGGIVDIGVSLQSCSLTAQVAQRQATLWYEEALSELLGKDYLQNLYNTHSYILDGGNGGVKDAVIQSPVVSASPNLDVAPLVEALNGIKFAINDLSQVMAQHTFDTKIPTQVPQIAETRSNGRSSGGSRSTTKTTYEEHTTTEGEAFTTGENWSTAWAEDSSHAADLTFDFMVQNSGTEYAREISGLIFNIYLGDDTEPLVSYPAWQQFSDGKLENVFPGSMNTFASNPVALTLEQMKRIDLGEKLRVELEDYSYGADELFYQDAVNGGVTVMIEDGVDDNNESVDTYVIPTWGFESVQDVIERYFPAGHDVEGELNALWTPEFNGINPPEFNEHFLSDIAWWYIYQTCWEADCAEVGATPLKDQSALPGSAILIRMNRDSDRDGYQDRVEWKYGTDKADPASHPQPNLIAGYTLQRSGDTVTALLKLANTGSFDAYAIEAVMVAPDDTITIGNNTVGGNGVVSPGQQIAVGSLVQDPNLAYWSASTAQPFAGGEYLGGSDKTYTFNVVTPGVVGASGAVLAWSDGAGGSGTLNLGSSYHAPLPVAVGSEGLQVAFDTGTLSAGEHFSVQALTPRDTFTFTVNSEPYTLPVIVVSYSDPQGSHRFIAPVQLDSLADDLTGYASQMAADVGVSIVTQAAFDPVGNNTTYLVVNNPNNQTLHDAHLYVNITGDGQPVAEITHTLDILPGPTVYPVVWNTSVFTEPYDVDAEYLLFAFWTDAQDNIIDSIARPLDSFGEDPLPKAETSVTSWNFGTVTKGTLLTKEIQVANNGFVPMFAHITSSNAAFSSSFLNISPASFGVMRLTLDTEQLNPGAFSGSLSLHTSDLAAPSITISVGGTIQAFTGQALAQSVDLYHPFDQYVSIAGPQNGWVVFTPTLSIYTNQMHPLGVYDWNHHDLIGPGSTSASLFFSQFQTISSVYIFDWEQFTIGADQYLISANYTNGSSNNINSILYRWNGSSFVVFQSIPTIGALDWEYFSIDGNHYLAVANNNNNGTAFTINSKIYRWNGSSFVEFQSIQTMGAAHWKYFMIGANHYLVVANRRDDLTCNVNSKVYRWNGSSFVEFQTIPTNCAENWEYFSIDINHYLAVANASNNATGNINSKIYRWNGSSFVEFQTITTNGAKDWEYFGIGADHFLVVANNNNDTTYNLNSKIYRWNGSIFAEYQTIPTNGADDWEYFFNGCHNLVVANNYNGSSYDIDSKLYIWNGSTFVHNQSFPTHGAAQWRGFNFGDQYYLAVANFANANSQLWSTEFGSSMAWQFPFPPYQITQLLLPKALDTNEKVRYWIQYGQLSIFSSGGGVQPYSFRIPKRLYSEFWVDVQVEDIVSLPYSFVLDLGANGSVDWQATGGQTNMLLNSGNLSAALNAYLASTPQAWGEIVTVPVNVTLNAAGKVLLTNLVLTPGGDSDPYLATADLSFDNTNPMETQVVGLSALVHNQGHMAAESVVASFFAGDPASGGIYLGSDFIASIPVGGSALAQLAFDTTGYSGNVEIYVLLDVAGQLYEMNENNNSAHKTLIIRTRPDLRIPALTPASAELTPGQAVTVTVQVSNTGQTAASTFELKLYDGPAFTGTLVQTAALSLPAGGQAVVPLHWTASTLGSHTLTAVVDTGQVVNESREDNNQAQVQVYVGWGAPVYIDSGGGSDPPYSPALGYGYLTEGTTVSCGAEPYQTYRQRASDEALGYRFDHLLPSHFYHLDLTFYLCSDQRELRVLVDGIEIASGIIANQGANTLSLLLDPSLYQDHSLQVSIEKTAGDLGGPVVSEIRLTDIHYCYRDSGMLGEVGYPGALDGCGWLDGSGDRTWGALPTQSVRIDAADNTLRYRFDGLNAGKHYRVNMTFYQGAGTPRQQRVEIDGLPTGLEVNLGDYLIHHESVPVPLEAYALDGSITVSVVRTNAAMGPIVSEIALEQVTVLEGMIPQAGDVRISNLRDTSFTVSWTTDVSSAGYVHSGATPALGRVSTDVRGSAVQDDTHYVTVSGLSPSTTYYFDLLSGDGVDDNGGGHYSVTTGPTLALPPVDTAYGQVYKPGGAQYASGAIVYLRLKDNNAAGSTGQSNLLSALVDGGSGYWTLNLGQARLANLSAYFSYSSSGDLDVIEVEGAGDCVAALEVNTANDSPLANIVLSCGVATPVGVYAGWNLLALPTTPEESPFLAQSMLNNLKAQSLACAELSSWADGGWLSRLDGIPINNFAVNMAAGYFARCTNAGSWSMLGLPLHAAIPINLQVGWNLVGIPYPASGYTAQTLLDGINAQGGNCHEADRWYFGIWEAHLDGLPGNNFTILPYQGYFVRCNQASVFTPGQGLLRPDQTALLGPLAPAAAEATIYAQQVTNRRDAAFSLAWRTFLPGSGWVEYGPTLALGQIAYDERGESWVSTLHQVTLIGLQPQTTYYVRLHSGADTLDQQVLTGATGSLHTPYTVHGQVLAVSGQPAAEALVFARLRDSLGNLSEMLSDLVDSMGYWVFSLALDDCQGYTLVLDAYAPDGSFAHTERPACASQPAMPVQLQSLRYIYLPVIRR